LKKAAETSGVWLSDYKVNMMPQKPLLSTLSRVCIMNQRQCYGILENTQI